METMLVQRRWQGVSDRAQKLCIALDRGEKIRNFLIVLQETAGVLKLFGHERDRDWNGGYRSLPSRFPQGNAFYGWQ